MPDASERLASTSERATLAALLSDSLSRRTLSLAQRLFHQKETAIESAYAYLKQAKEMERKCPFRARSRALEERRETQKNCADWPARKFFLSFCGRPRPPRPPPQPPSLRSPASLSLSLSLSFKKSRTTGGQYTNGFASIVNHVSPQIK